MTGGDFRQHLGLCPIVSLNLSQFLLGFAQALVGTQVETTPVRLPLASVRNCSSLTASAFMDATQPFSKIFRNLFSSAIPSAHSADAICIVAPPAPSVIWIRNLVVRNLIAMLLGVPYFRAVRMRA